jgi:hypothetical protein
MSIIYTDRCCDQSVAAIKNELGRDLIVRLDMKSWTISDALSIITLPSLELAVINIIDEVSVMEIGLLHFMCKPILITSETIKNYPVIKDKVIDYIDLDSDLRNPYNNFIEWFNLKWEAR